MRRAWFFLLGTLFSIGLSASEEVLRTDVSAPIERSSQIIIGTTAGVAPFGAVAGVNFDLYGRLDSNLYAGLDAGILFSGRAIYYPIGLSAMIRSEEGAILPFLGIGFGILAGGIGEDLGYSFALSVRPGLEMVLTPTLSIAIEGRTAWIAGDQNGLLFHPNASVVIPFES